MKKTLLESVGIEARPPGLANSRLPLRHWLQYQLFSHILNQLLPRVRGREDKTRLFSSFKSEIRFEPLKVECKAYLLYLCKLPHSRLIDM